MNTVTKFLLFPIPLVLYVIVMYNINNPRFDRVIIDLNDTENLIIGDSHLRYSVNPQLIDKSINLCTSAEPIFLSYIKLKRLLNSKNNLKKIFLGVGYHNLTIADESKYTNNKWAVEMYTRTVPIMDIDETVSYIPFDEIEYLKYRMMNLLFKPFNVSFYKRKTFGGFVNSKLNRLTDEGLRSVIDRHYYEDGKIISTSQNIPKLLEVIASLCEKNKIQLYLVNTPLHKQYFDQIPEIHKENYTSQLTKLQEQFPNTVQLIQTSQFALPDKAFQDFDHLNRDGSEPYTYYLKKEYVDISENL